MRRTATAARTAERNALTKARGILGSRALVRRQPDAAEPCVILRAEQALEGRRYEVEFGRGRTWTIALRRAEARYHAIRAKVRVACG